LRSKEAMTRRFKHGPPLGIKKATHLMVGLRRQEKHAGHARSVVHAGLKLFGG
jgi:hypothetical protein